MRCRNCNVDLPESYTACPLCGSKASNDEPLIKDIRTAEYPKVKTEPYKRNPFPVFLGIWLTIGLISLLLKRFDIISELACGIIICAVPAVWTLFLRPVLVKQLFPGNYVMMNIYPFALASFVYSKITYASIDKAISLYLPLSCIAVMVGLAVIILLNRKEIKRAASYPVLMLPVTIAGIIASLAVGGTVSPYWLVTLLIIVLIFAAVYISNPNDVKQELEAKFSLQKPISYHINNK